MCALSAVGPGCSDEADGLNGTTGNGSNGEVENACGPVVSAVGTECDDFYDCPGTATLDNVAQPEASCEHCVDHAQVNVCEAGECRRIDISNNVLIQANVEGNNVTEIAGGYAEILLTPITADGRRLTCAELLSTCTDYDDPRLNPINSNSGRAPFLRNQQTPLVTDAAERDDLIYVVLITEGRGRGEIYAAGCADGVVGEFSVTDPVTPTIIPRAIQPTEWPPRGR